MVRGRTQGTGFNHCASGVFDANANRLIAATLAHNLIGWIRLIGASMAPWLANAKTLRRGLLAVRVPLTPVGSEAIATSPDLEAAV